MKHFKNSQKKSCIPILLTTAQICLVTWASLKENSGHFFQNVSSQHIVRVLTSCGEILFPPDWRTRYISLFSKRVAPLNTMWLWLCMATIHSRRSFSKFPTKQLLRSLEGELRTFLDTFVVPSQCFCWTFLSFAQFMCMCTAADKLSALYVFVISTNIQELMKICNAMQQGTTRWVL